VVGEGRIRERKGKEIPRTDHLKRVTLSNGKEEGHWLTQMAKYVHGRGRSSRNTTNRRLLKKEEE